MVHRGMRSIAVVALMVGVGCSGPVRPSDVVVFASGTDLESANPLVTIHPLSRQIQRYVLFVTLARYDSALQPVPYAAHSWEWSADRRTLTFHLAAGIKWHDGRPTTASDVAFTILAGRDPSTGFARSADLAGVDTAMATSDSTAVIRFRDAQASLPLIFCELPIVPSHLLERTQRR